MNNYGPQVHVFVLVFAAVIGIALIYCYLHALSEYANAEKDLMMQVADRLADKSSAEQQKEVSLKRFADEVGRILDDYVGLFIDISNKSVRAVQNMKDMVTHLDGMFVLINDILNFSKSSLATLHPIQLPVQEDHLRNNRNSGDIEHY